MPTVLESPLEPWRCWYDDEKEEASWQWSWRHVAIHLDRSVEWSDESFEHVECPRGWRDPSTAKLPGTADFLGLPIPLVVQPRAWKFHRPCWKCF